MKIALDIGTNIDSEVESWAASYLKERGYDVARPAENWETIPAIASRLGVHCVTVSRAISTSKINPHVPQAVVHRGPNGRVLSVCSNRHFDNFIRRNLAKTNGS